jgi:hypothetical protein
MGHRESMTRRTILRWLALSPAATVGWLAALASDSPTRAHAEAGGAGRCLPTGADLEGPAVIEEPAASTVVFPGQRLRVDEFGNLVIETEVEG